VLVLLHGSDHECLATIYLYIVLAVPKNTFLPLIKTNDEGKRRPLSHSPSSNH
jgi:hypothetical protein